MVLSKYSVTVANKFSFLKITLFNKCKKTPKLLFIKKALRLKNKDNDNASKIKFHVTEPEAHDYSSEPN